MQHLVVVAHPSAESFTMAVTRVYVGELARLGHQVVTCDLYRSGFNPVLAAHELAAGHPGFVAADADVGTAQRLIRRSDVLTVIYPLWWLSMPAILKGYIDRVFARGFAYQARGG
ncbi:MAG TPA: NAD(P)H-dependent oxidoreductase, partial [Steroidobacteraceae bacterium]|nr:NAD(P)H-dependent oxidoreductase [Steroidobacteraceae bacterium]